MVMLKEGVAAKGIRAEAVLALLAASSVFGEHGVPMVVTSITEGKHMKESLHAVGLAIDLRLPSRYTGREQSNGDITQDLKDCLGRDFDVILEGDHIHVEFDPKESVT